MSTYGELTGAGVTTRSAAALTGIPRATATRAKATAAKTDPVPRPAACPANKLSLVERTQVLEILDSEEFVDQAPLQVYATLLERGQYLCSVSTMYRILAEAGQVTERRRWLATRRARSPSWSPPAPGRCTPGTSPSCPDRPRGSTTTPT